MWLGGRNCCAAKRESGGAGSKAILPSRTTSLQPKIIERHFAAQPRKKPLKNPARLLNVENLRVYFPVRKGILRRYGYLKP